MKSVGIVPVLDHILLFDNTFYNTTQRPATKMLTMFRKMDTHGYNVHVMAIQLKLTNQDLAELLDDSDQRWIAKEVG